MKQNCPIGIFDSGYGGLTVYEEVVKALPDYDFIYLGDNARTPYGTRSFEVIYQYTEEAVNFLFERGCQLIIIACNTASAEALRNIQQKFLPAYDPNRRVLGVIRPSVEAIGNISKSKVVGVLGTEGTIRSQSYVLEINKLFPEVKVIQQACPMWVPLVENHETDNEGAEFFIKREIDALLKQSSQMDTVILGCTHYPHLIDLIKKHLPDHINLLVQGTIVADSLVDYLQRHGDIDQLCTKSGKHQFFTTENSDNFSLKASQFLREKVEAETTAL